MYPALFPVQRRVFSGMSALMLFAMCLTLFSPCGVPLARAVVDGQAATLVLGQPDFITATTAATATGMNTPLGVAVDPTTDKVFVADRSNNRVLRFASLASLSNGVAADGVFGQADFTSTLANRSSTVNTNTLNLPYGVTVDITGTLWVADTSNSRVLRFANAATKLDGAPADGVLGQADFTSNAINRNGGATQNTLNYPAGVVVDSTGSLWVADTSNSRVLRFASAATKLNGDPADGVLGQADFISNASNRSATVAATTLYAPLGVTVDITGTLWVADTSNHRVLRFASAATKLNGDPADGVLGQFNFMSNASNRGTMANANTLSSPQGVAVDSTGTLWVADTSNNRVLRFTSAASMGPGANADSVLGQSGFMNGFPMMPDINTLYAPAGVAVDSTGTLWVADTSNHRTVRFASAASKGFGANADSVLGQADFTNNRFNRDGFTAAANTLRSPSGAAVDPTTGKVFVADISNNRVLRFTSLSSGANADGVLGQADFTSNLANRGGSTATANTLYFPQGVTVDSTGTLWVTDSGNHRVLRFTSAASMGPGAAADGVLGQADFTSNVVNRTGSPVAANTLSNPIGVTVDSTGTLWVADTNNNRVLRFANAATKLNGDPADGVLGQADFANNTGNRGATVAANTLTYPSGVAVDSTGTLWVADKDNHRVLRFANAATKLNGDPADGVLGQADFISNASNRNGGAAQNTLNYPSGVAVDSTGTLWVADKDNHRVLRFANAATKLDGATADGVLGQADFTSNLSNRDGFTVAANTLRSPSEVMVDSTNTLWVADSSNNRVLRYVSTDATLSSLTLSSGTLSPIFAVGTLSYTASVATIVSSLTVTPTVADSTATVTVNGISAATPVGLNVGANLISILVTAQNSNTQPYTLTVTRRSNNANLSGLTLSSGTLLSPVFAPGTTSYTATVAAVGKIAVTPTVTDTTATITVNGTPVSTGSASGFSTLNVGANTIPVVVTAQDGNTQTYTVTVTRLPNNADLSNLTLSSGSFSPVFAAATTSYSLTVGNSYTDLALTPTVADVAATVTVSGTLVTSGTPLTVTLAVGANVVPLVVTAQDGTTQSYTLTVTRSAFVWSSEQPALMVLGQSGLGSTAPNGGASTPSRATLSQPTSVTVARTSGKVFVVDRDNHRVMRFASVASLSNGAAAEVVFGQPDFDSGEANAGISVGASSLNQPSDAVVGDDDTLWIADSGNNRVLRFANATNCATNASADGVLGQPDLTSGGNGTNATTLQTPSRLAIGGDGTLWVSDGGNHRVLRFTDAKNKADANGAAADGVLGQSDFNSGSASTVAAATLNNPAGMVASNDGTLWVADGGNNRVLRFADAAHQPNGAAADGVLGQPDFTSGGATSATTTTLQSPGGLAMSSDGTLWVADGGNNRMVRYDDAAHQPNGAAADGVLGQPNFTSNGSNRGGTATGTSLSHPGGMTVLDGDMLWIADSSNHRVLQVGMPSNNASLRTLTLSSGSLSPTFASTSYTYTVAVGNAITSLSLTPTKGFASATLTVTLNGAVVSPLNLPLNLGPNQIALLVTAQDGITTQTYRLTVTRAGSSNALLSSLTLSSGSLSPSFSPNTLTYVASVANNVMSLTITPTVSAPTAIVMVDGTLLRSGSASGSRDLSVGPNTFVILVTAQDGTPQTYSLTVTRHSNNANLRSLTLSSGVLSPPFSADTTNYTVTLPNGRTNLTVRPTVADANATVTVNGGSVGSGLSLALGANPIIVRVTAQDGTTTQIYNLNAIRPVGNDASLSNLALSSGTLNPPFAAATTTYTVSVSTNISGLILTPVVNDPTATVTVNGGSAMSIISLALGPNPLTVRVIAQDGTTTQTYSVIVTRVAASNANLSNLTLSRGRLSPAFATGISTYTVAVANSVTSLTVTPTVSDTTSTIKVNSVTVISGHVSDSITLTVGANPVTVLVTAQDGSTQTYTLIVTRAGQAAISITQTYTLVQEPTAQRTALATLSNTLTLTITVGNTGPDAVTGVMVVDNFPAAAVGTVWTWTCIGAGGALCGSANGTGNLNETLKLLPKDGYVTFIVTGSLLNPNHWQNIPHLITPSEVVDTGNGHDPVVVGTYQSFIPLIAR